MQPFTTHTGVVAALDRANVDTDQIIPKQFLKRIERTGFGQFLFCDWRFLADGSANPDFELNRPAAAGASILLARRNFGCGSSREHAPQSLMRRGIRALIGESFAEIFFGNCLALGIPCLSAEPDTVRALQEAIAADPGAELLLDLEALEVELESEFVGANRWRVHLDPGPHQMLVSGQWDGTGQLLANGVELDRTMGSLPYLRGF